MKVGKENVVVKHVGKIADSEKQMCRWVCRKNVIMRM
jgi:hypothetical protein